MLIHFSSFIFLRFFCPAILNPKLFNMMPGLPFRFAVLFVTNLFVVRSSLGSDSAKPDADRKGDSEPGQFCAIWGQGGIHGALQRVSDHDEAENHAVLRCAFGLFLDTV